MLLNERRSNYAQLNVACEVEGNSNYHNDQKDTKPRGIKIVESSFYGDSRGVIKPFNLSPCSVRPVLFQFTDYPKLQSSNLVSQISFSHTSYHRVTTKKRK